jgi:hypothetical protein
MPFVIIRGLDEFLVEFCEFARGPGRFGLFGLGGSADGGKDEGNRQKQRGAEEFNAVSSNCQNVTFPLNATS